MLCRAALLVLALAALPARAQGGVSARADSLGGAGVLEDLDDAEQAAYLWIDTFREVETALVGLEHAAGIQADSLMMPLEAWYDTPPAGPELARRGLVRVAQSAAVASARLRDAARITVLLGPAETRATRTRRLDAAIGPLRGVLDEAARLAAEAVVCGATASPPAAATACGPTADPAVWMQMRREIARQSDATERALLGAGPSE